MVAAAPRPRDDPIGVEPPRAGVRPSPPNPPNGPIPSEANSESGLGKFTPAPARLVPMPPTLVTRPAPSGARPAASEPKSATPLEDDDPMSTRLSSAPR